MADSTRHVRCCSDDVFSVRLAFIRHFCLHRLAALALLALAFSSQAARLVWDPNNPTPASYNVYYSAADVPLQQRNVGLDTFFDLDFLPAGKIYTLYVTAVAEDRLESDPSTSVTYSPTLSEAPVVVTAPASQSILLGQSFSLSVFATGTAPLSYQWFKGGVAITGATASIFSVSAAQLSDAGSYTVRVSNTVGSVVSAPASITVLIQPSITAQPVGQTVNVGSSASLNVSATGSAPLSYQWLKNGVIIPGATSATFSLSNVQATDNGLYTVTVSNGAGSATSVGATITVLTPPSIATQPQSRTVNLGSPATFSVVAAGSAPLSYQWLKFGANIPGANASTLSIAAVTAGDEGSYSVRVSNGGGSASSSIAAVTVITPPAITTQPLSQTVNFGAAINLTVQATGSAPLTYRWQKDGVVIPAATGPTLQVASAATSDGGVYIVDVSNTAGTVTSSPAVVTVFLPDAPVITQQPQSVNVNVGSPINLTVQATGTAPITFQWLKNGSPLPGEISSTLTVASAQSSHAGSYVVRVSNIGGSTLSAAATVTVGVPPSITVQPASLTLDAGLDADFVVQANGSPPLSYQWSRNGVPIPGETGSALTIFGITSANAGSYQVQISNNAGNVLSQAATLTVTGAPSINTQPQGQTIPYGGTISLTVQATGAAPLTYRWIKSGTFISGANAATYQVVNADQTHSGQYSVEISNGAGQVTSQPVTVTVQPPLAPTITQQPASINLEPGTSMLLTAAATGTAPLAYQWLKNDTLIVGATAPTFQIPSVQPSDAGSYKVRVSNIGGNAVSQAAVLTVGTAPSITQQPASQTLQTGSPVTFTVQASGSAPLTYRWSKSGIVISGAVNSSYTIASISSSDAGSYSVEVTNFAGNVVSQSAVLTVIVPPSITTQPASRAVDVGGSTTFSVEATGTGPLQYQWRRNGTPLAGATSPTLQISPITLDNGGIYTVQITGPGGSIVSQPATLTVTGAPAIVTSPQGQTLSVGSPLTLTVQASGAAPLNYQWHKNGANISGATSSTFSIASVQTGDAATYTVTVSNGAGSATSSGATVTVLTPPQITTQPQSRTVNAGSPATLTVVASGSAPLNYQWLRLGTPIPNAIDPNYSIPAAAPADAGTYSVRVSNQVGTVTSVSVQIVVISPPAITTQPVGQTLNAGSTLTLSVTASGSLPLSYQWTKDGADISGATAAQFVKPAIQASDAGDYSVRVSNPAGTATANTVSVVVITPPAITVQPASQTVNFGALLQLSVQVTGSQPLTFVWKKDGTTIPGATTGTFEIASAGTTDGGIYTVTISNGAGSVTSQPAVVSVSLPDAPTINIQPQSANVTVGLPINLSVQATGSGVLSYQWLKDGSPISGATSAQYSVASAQTSDAGTYNVRVSNAGGATLSASAIITVGAPPSITLQPATQSALAGTDVEFSVGASGSSPLLYRWLKNGIFITGATEATLRIAQVKASDAGSYQVEVSNNVGTILSQTAVLTVTGAPSITTQPANQNIAFGSPFSLSVVATGAQPLVYRWIKDGVEIAGATASIYSVGSADLTHSGGYRVEISNGAGQVVSQTATVTVAQPLAPVIVQQPTNLRVEPSSTAVFTVQATSLAALSYQWFKNQTPIAGATSSTFQIASVQAGDAGSYTVQVSNIGGSVTSASATLAVGTPPSITTQPSSQTVPLGTSVTLFVQASGTSPLSYRWSKSGVLIPGATSSGYTIPQVAESDAGSYSVEISNIAGTITSQSALLSVTVPDKLPIISAQPTSRSADVGSATTFFVEASGSGALEYQWIRDGLVLPGATNATLLISPITSLDGGTYLVEVSNSIGSVVSDPATLTITGAPTIVSSPQSQSISVSNSLILSVQVTGVEPLTYRWIKSGAYIPNATSPIFEIPAVQLSDSGTYTVEVSNGAGTVLSDPAFIQVVSVPVGGGTQTGTAPSITRHPVGQTVQVGGSATFTVDATGTGPLSFFWIHNGVYIPDANSAIFTISATELSDAGNYSVEVRNGVGSIVSDSANLSVVGAPAFLIHPQSQTLAIGSALALSVEVTGAAPITYRWIRNGAYIPGATNANFLIPAVQLINGGDYSVEVSNPAGLVTSQIATITVLPEITEGTPAFTRHPESVTIEVGKPSSFTAEATGLAPLTYQWRRNGEPITGATSATLTLAETKVSDAGVYTVEVSNSVGSIVSRAASLTVTGAPQIITQPRSQSVTVGNVLALSVEVTGAAPLTFRWIKSGAIIPSATNINYIVPSAQFSDAGIYSVEVSNAAGNVLSLSALVSVLTVNTNDPGTNAPSAVAPLVTRDPVSQSVEIGSPVTLSIEAVGSLPMTFRWIRNGLYLENATSPILTIPSAGLADEGSYSVEISNEAGVILSRPATLVLTGEPVVTRHPQSQALLVGESLVLSVGVTGVAPLEYRWIKDGNYISGATNANFILPAAQLIDAGSYSVQIDNALNEAVSFPALVTVSADAQGGTNAPPRITGQPVSQTVTAGTAATFSVQVTSATPLSYSWIKNGAFIPGANSATLTFAAVSLADAGTYAVQISNDAGQVVSESAALEIGGAPVILTHPQGQSLTAGDELNLSVQFHGVRPATFRWIKGGAYITGATNQNFTKTAVQLSDASSYAVEISNEAGTVVSLEAAVRVSPLPTTGGGTGGGGLVIPEIVQQPVSQTIDVGAQTIFTVQATSSSPLTYQWIHNSAYIPGAVSAVLSIPITKASDAGAYAVEVSSTNATIISQIATLEVSGEPEIISSPENQEVPAGSTLFLFVDVVGAQPMSFRWVKNGTYIPGATNASYTVSNFARLDSGTYWVEVSNAAGEAISRSAFIDIGGEPIITLSPVSRTVAINSPLTLTVEVDGAAPFKFQWIKGGTIIPGATNASLAFAAIQQSDAGIYSVEVSNGAGEAASAPAQITVTGAPFITEQPASQTVPVGSPITLNVEVGGVAPFDFKWIKGGAYIPNATSKTFVIDSAKITDSGAYSVEISNGAGQIVSDIASVQVISTNTTGTNSNIEIVITKHPQSQVADAGGEAVFTVEASGPAELAYLWSRNGTFIAGATNDTLTVENLKLADAGTYAVQITCTNLTANSEAAILTVLGAPVITAHPQNQSIPINGRLELSVQVRGAQPFTYAWIRNGAYVPGATNQSFVIPSVVLLSGGTYSVEVSNGAGMVASRTAQVVITGAPVIHTPPASQAVPIGGSFTLTVGVNGTAPFTYRWIKGGAFISGATNSTHSVSSVQLSHGGAYQVEVSNGAGQDVSAVAQITVTEAPVILEQPASQTVAVGSPINLNVEVGGAAPFTFRWLKGGAPITDATNKTFVIATAQISDSGSYSVEVNNSKGQAVSQSAVITVTNQATSNIELAIAPTLAGFADITITAPPGEYDLESTPSLGAAWQILLTTNIVTVTKISVPVGSGTQRFYRLVQKSGQVSEPKLNVGLSDLTTGIIGITITGTPGSYQLRRALNVEATTWETIVSTNITGPTVIPVSINGGQQRSFYQAVRTGD